jgi:hypothetical protein
MEQTPRFIVDADHLRATVLGDAPDRLLVTFDHWQVTKTDFTPVRTRSTFVENGFTHLHLATRQNDWFLNPDLPGALKDIAEFAAPFARKVALGFSMGGFGALMLSRVVAFDRLLLVSPHSTFSPEYPPFDDRFASAMVAPEFAAIAYETILAGPTSAAECVVLYDSTTAFDTDHAGAVTRLFRETRLVDLKGGGHPATRLLTDNNRFGLVVKAITGGALDAEPLLRVHNGLVAGVTKG